MHFANHPTFESYTGSFKDNQMHGRGTLRLRGGNVYVGGFEDDKRHGFGYLLDYGRTHKVREEWVRGDQKPGSTVSEPSTRADLDAHLGASPATGGLYHPYQAGPMSPTLLRHTQTTNVRAKAKAS